MEHGAGWMAAGPVFRRAGGKSGLPGIAVVGNTHRPKG
ncbi:hypothetical protein THTE_3559 [Thermogutta terrifontis]|uniref:Uncharacterized protein n=1 Tax=Thermogutta terrifontis TaxID=1331910 RepID=A0A286RJL2_9BACT|nr:hypothetical protein THTE_3559 [Thermogutta terrifontis]